MRRFLTTISLCLAMWAQGQNKSQIEHVVLKFCPTAHIVETENKYGFIEVDLICDGINCEMILDTAMNIISIEKEIPVEQLSAKIRKRIDKKYFSWDIDEASLVETQHIQMTKVELVQNGFEQTLYFSADDKLIKDMEATASFDYSSRQLQSLSIYSELKYDLFAPEKRFEMPEILTEISGIALAYENMVLCIQDELGVVFEYNMSSEKIERIIRFSDVGDYEDLMLLNDTVWVLRSDGAVFSFPYKKFNGKTGSHYFSFQSLNIEGICYDKFNSKILFAAKEGDIGGIQSDRYIYATNGNESTKPFLQIKGEEIAQLFRKNFGTIIQISIEFQPSAIDIHPITKETYILSATDRMLAVYNKENKLKTVVALPADLFYKPEGIAFMANGDLLISNEGKKNGSLAGEILLFKMLK